MSALRPIADVLLADISAFKRTLRLPDWCRYYCLTVKPIPPSLVETPLMHRSTAQAGFPLESIVQMIPIARPGTPADIAGACAYLASDDANYVTGQLLSVNGGMYM